MASWGDVDGDLRIAVLGPLEVSRPEGPVQVVGPKRRALLALLALHPHQVLSPDRLVEDLWDGHPPSRAAATLQSHVSHLRRDLGTAGKALVTRARGYELAIDPRAVDARVFDDAVAGAADLGSPATVSAALTDALALWRGPALAEFDGAGWATAEVVRLEERRAHAIQLRIEAELRLGRHAALVPELQRLVADQPLREHWWTLLMLALQGAGRHIEALRAAHRFREVLRDSGLSSSPAFDEVERAVLLHEVPPGHDEAEASPRPRPRPRPRPGVPAPGPQAADAHRMATIGRDDEIARTRQAMAAAEAGHRRLVVLTGEPGIGKTRVLTDLCDSARSAGARVLVGHCDDGLDVPYQPFVDALQQFVDAERADPDRLGRVLGSHPGELTRLVPTLSSVVPAADPRPDEDTDIGRYRLFEAVRTWLESIAADGLVVFAIEDLHWATRPTLLLLRHIVRAAGPARLLLIATCRESDLAQPERQSLFVDLVCHESALQLPLARLDEGDVGRLVELWRREGAGRGLRIDPGFPTVMATATGGNPLFIVESLRHLTERRGAGDATGRLTPADLSSFPRTVHEVVRQRLNRLSKGAGAALTAAAVLGRTFAMRELLAMLPASEAELLDCLWEASRAGFIEPMAGDPLRYEFCHALVAEVLVAGLSDGQRALAHRDAGLALERLAGRTGHAGGDGHVVELARHFTAAAPVGEAPRAVRYSRAAGDQAIGRHAADEAATHYRTALTLLDQCPEPDDHERCDLMMDLGEALRRLPGGEHRDIFLAAARLAADLHNPGHLARAAKALGRSFVLTDAPDPERIEVVEQALVALEDGEDATRARLLATLAGERRLAGQRALSLELAERAVALARRAGDHRTLVTTQLMRWDLVWDPSTLDSRRSLVADLSASAAGLDDPVLRARAEAVGLVLALETGDGAEAARRLAAVERRTLAIGAPYVTWTLPLLRSTVAVAAGRLAEAEGHVHEALQGAVADGRADAQLASTGQLVHLYCQQGRFADALLLTAPAMERLPAARAIHAWACCETGRLDEGREVAGALLAGGELLLPRDLTWPVGVLALAEALRHLGAADDAERLAPVLLPFRQQFFASVWYFAGPVAHGLGSLAAAAGDRERADGWYAEAEARCEAFPAPGFARRARKAREALHT